MTQTFDLRNMGFTEMQNAELEVIDGGGFWSDLVASVEVAVGVVWIAGNINSYIGVWQGGLAQAK